MELLFVLLEPGQKPLGGYDLPAGWAFVVAIALACGTLVGILTKAGVFTRKDPKAMVPPCVGRETCATEIQKALQVDKEKMQAKDQQITALLEGERMNRDVLADVLKELLRNRRPG